MRLIFTLVLLLGVAIAGGAVYMAQTYVASYQAALEEERNANRGEEYVPLAAIYVADRKISYGEPITPSDVTLIQYPEEYLPEGVFSEDNPLFFDNQDARIALRDIERYEPVSLVKLSEPGAPPGLTARLEKGQRAFAIKVDVASGVSGFLRPEDKVDVYWTGAMANTPLGATSGEVTRLIQSGVRLIAVDQNSSVNPGETTIARTVTVAVTPSVVASLAHAQSTGRLSLSLIGNDDDTVSEAIEMDQLKLLGLQPQLPEVTVEAPPAPRVCTIRTRKGSEVVEIPIPCGN